MITKEQAESSVGLKVVYRAPHVPPNEPGEEGVITSVNDSGAFVRYGAELTSKLTPFDRLVLVTLEVSANRTVDFGPDHGPSLYESLGDEAAR